MLIAFYGAETAGPFYDAYLHAVFVGFVFSMIFGPDPIIGAGYYECSAMAEERNIIC